MATKRLLTDDTFAAKLDSTNDLLAMIAGGQVLPPSSWADISAIVRKGLAPRFFRIGDQLTVTWADGNDHTYTVPLDVVHFCEVEAQHAGVVPGMILQWHYTTPIDMPFDEVEAFYYCEEALAAGTYHITSDAAWGSHGITSGKSFQFTTTQTVPAGGHLKFSTGVADHDISEWKVYTYASGATTTEIETINSVTEGSGGTSLGTWSLNNCKADSSSNVNQMQRCAYGYNRWSQSCKRQWLNSAAAKGAWWTSQNKFDRVPTQCASHRGFMAGFDSDFLAVLKPIKITTALNTVTDDTIGTKEDTYDTFFLPSLEQEYWVPQLSGAEGEAWEYWKMVANTPAPSNPHPSVYPERIRYGVDNLATARNVRLRSATRGYAHGTWYVLTSGCANYYAAYGAYRCAPACVIC